MERVAKFLQEAGTYYLATVDGDQPRVRPFGTAHIFEGKLYIQTGKVKDVYFTLEIATQAVTAKRSDGTDATLTEAWSKAGVSVTFPSN